MLNVAEWAEGASWCGPTEDAGSLKVPPIVARCALEEARGRGLNVGELIEGLAFTEADLLDPAFRLSYPIASEAIRRVAHAIKDPEIGLTIGRRHHILSWGLVGMGAMACANLGMAIVFGLRYQSEAGSLLALKADVTQNEFAIVASPRFADVSIERMLVESTFAALLAAARTMWGESQKPLRVELVSTQPAKVETYQDVFQCPIHFSCLDNRLIFDKSLSQCPVETADVATMRLAMNTLDNERLRIAPLDNTRAAIEAEVRAHLHAPPTQAEVSELLGLNERTLRRRLQEEGCQYQDIVDQVRRSRALELLVLGKKPAEQVASLVGFSNVRGLSRAFRRWTGFSLSAT